MKYIKEITSLDGILTYTIRDENRKLILYTYDIDEFEEMWEILQEKGKQCEKEV